MKNRSSGIFISSAIVAVLLLTGCEGDTRVLTEPVEANRLGLVSLKVVQPAGTLTPLYINPEEQISLSLQGTNAAGRSIDVDSRNRRWTLTDDSVATINEDGFLTGLQTGQVQVRAVVGEVWSPALTVEVSLGTLESISAIVGAANLQPCVAQTYTATGRFSDQSIRGLPDVAWTIAPQGSATLTDGDLPGSIVVSVNTPGDVTLNASIDGLNEPATLTTDSSLDSITLFDNIRVPANLTLQLDANGNYITAEGTQPKRITDGVSWSISKGEDFASISSSGALSGIKTGAAEVRAACGDIAMTAPVEITTAQGVLSAPDGTEETLLLGGAGVQLNVEEDGTNVNELASWGVVGENTGIARVSNTTDSKGFVTAVARGETTIRANYKNDQIEFTITVR